MAAPPARSAFIGSPRTLSAAKIAVTVEGTAAGESFGPSLVGGSLTYERDLGGLREIIVTPTAGLIQERSEYLRLSLDMKQSIPETHDVAFTYGAGYLWNGYGPQTHSFKMFQVSGALRWGY